MHRRGEGNAPSRISYPNDPNNKWTVRDNHPLWESLFGGKRHSSIDQFISNGSKSADLASQFKPERFLNGSTPPAFMSFSKPPRDCIGTNLAYLEVCPYRN